ncbi:MAG: MBL fold metallo-hydrolase [Lachnospiraceae bacterium]|nr:MBL fold metallo-hydrolase [Lachnospiraceae bacterium]
MPDIKIGKITLGMCETNTYFIYREGSKDAVVFDPADKGEYLYDKLAQNDLCPKAIMLTHGHFDHIWGIEGIKKNADIPVYASEDERALLKDTRLNCSASCGRPCSIEADHYLKDGETVNLCGIEIKMIKTPGHTEGGCCFYIAEAGFLIAGDTLFCESVGRSDLPTGSMGTLVRSIKEKLLTLPADTKVYPGHGGPTTIAYEKEYNPFL